MSKPLNNPLSMREIVRLSKVDVIRIRPKNAGQFIEVKPDELS